jgi:hypothetical protein
MAVEMLPTSTGTMVMHGVAHAVGRHAGLGNLGLALPLSLVFHTVFRYDRGARVRWMEPCDTVRVGNGLLRGT